jgi:hypothetical protein
MLILRRGEKDLFVPRSRPEHGGNSGAGCRWEFDLLVKVSELFPNLLSDEGVVLWQRVA